MRTQRIAYSWAAFVAWAAASVLAAVVHKQMGENAYNAWPDSPPFLVYSAILFFPLAAFLIWGPAFRALRDFPKPHRSIVVVFFLAVTLGHLANAGRQSFPFMDWQMFTRSVTVNEFVYHDYFGIRRDGTKLPINLVQLYPTLDQSRFYVGFTRFGETARRLDEPELWKIYDDVLTALARRHNKLNPESPAFAIEVMRTRLPVDGPELSPQLLRRTNLTNNRNAANTPR